MRGLRFGGAEPPARGPPGRWPPGRFPPGLKPPPGLNPPFAGGRPPAGRGAAMPPGRRGLPELVVVDVRPLLAPAGRGLPKDLPGPPAFRKPPGLRGPEPASPPAAGRGGRAPEPKAGRGEPKREAPGRRSGRSPPAAGLSAEGLPKRGLPNEPGLPNEAGRAPGLLNPPGRPGALAASAEGARVAILTLRS